MNLIVAVNEEWGIGCDGELLSKIPEDMAYFKQKTLGKVVIMGNSTYKSLPGLKPLKDRVNIVMSKDTNLRIRGALVCNSLKDIIYISNMCCAEDVFIIGGQSIYEQFLPYCSTAYVTKIKTNSPQKADKFFPNLDAMPNWKLVDTSETNFFREIEYNFAVFENVNKNMKMMITEAQSADLQQILQLQYLAYQSEAKLLNDYSIPPLKQTIGEVKQEYEKGVFLKAVDEEGNIVGSVRAYLDNNTAYIGKLIVLPEKQGQGVGTELMLAIERECAVARYELFTSDKSVRNIQLYERLGYAKYKEQKVADGLTFVYLEKYPPSNSLGNRK